MMEIRKGTLQDTEEFLKLMRFVRAGMERKDWLYLDPPELVRELMEKKIMELWVAMDGDTMAAAFSITTPGLGADNYGHDLGFSREELLHVIHMDTAVVHPGYRGQGLQKKLMETAQESIRCTGDHILLCTIHPENRFSLENVLKQGYSIQKTLKKYGSIRHILRKDLEGDRQ